MCCERSRTLKCQLHGAGLHGRSSSDKPLIAANNRKAGIVYKGTPTLGDGWKKTFFGRSQ
uniref:Uncharacterized protein n=1 Tax=Heterorhabditis bacteriophora TaxID=37862 RepID=A0A1I7WZ77_HETBA